MSLMSWLLILELIVFVSIIIWLVRRLHKHAKHSPAQKALELHLAELESAKKASKVTDKK